MHDYIKILIGLFAIIGLISLYKFIFTQVPKESNAHISVIKEKFTIIDPKYKKIDIVAGEPGKGSYTLGKKKIVMCTVDPQTGIPYDEHTQMYVALHELAHVITKNYDEHGPEFQTNFSNLLKEAQQKGVYRPIYRPPATYCT